MDCRFVLFPRIPSSFCSSSPVGISPFGFVFIMLFLRFPHISFVRSREKNYNHGYSNSTLMYIYIRNKKFDAHFTPWMMNKLNKPRRHGLRPRERLSDRICPVSEWVWH